MCAGPGGSPKDPMISRPGALDRMGINEEYPVIAGPKKEEEPKKEEKKA